MPEGIPTSGAKVLISFTKGYTFDMEFNQIIKRTAEIREKYAKLEKKKYGKEWTTAQIAEGFVGDVGDLMKLIMAKQGVREVADVDAKLKHELSDCLWSILVLAKELDIDIEKSFLETMDALEVKISKGL